MSTSISPDAVPNAAGQDLRVRRIAAYAAFVVLITSPFSSIFGAAFADVRTSPADGGRAGRVVADVLSSSFVENLGQLGDDGIRYYLPSGRLLAGFSRGAVLYVLQDSGGSAPTLPGLPAAVSIGSYVNRRLLVRVHFDGANPVDPEGREEQPYRSHHVLGNDPARWRTDVRRFGLVVYEDLYDGIDLVYYGGPTGLKYDFVVHPGSAPDRIVLRYEGVTGLTIDRRGGAIARTLIGDLRDDAVRARQSDGDVPCAFVLRAADALGIECGSWDRSAPLVIDPLVYSTRLGGSDDDVARGVAVDASGNAYVTGMTWSPDFPTTPGVVDSAHAGQTDVFVAKLDSEGKALVYATFLGGGGSEEAYAIAVDAEGHAYVTGYTTSPTFPTTPDAVDISYNNQEDVFVAELAADGAALRYSTFLGGRNLDIAHSIAVDPSGAAYVTGYTNSTNFPATPGAFQATLNRAYDAFVAKLSPDGSALLYSTFLGGTSSEFALSIAVDSAGNAYTTGSTLSSDFPTTPGSFAMAAVGSYDVFVTKLDPMGTDLVYSTYIGGRFSDQANGLALDATGNVVVVGNTVSTDFPTTPGAFDRSLSGVDAFVTKLNASGSALVYSTHLGGVSLVYAYAVAVDAAGDAFVTGATRATNFPTTSDAYDVTYNGEFDAFVTEFSPEGGTVVYSTFLGALQDDVAFAIAVDSGGNAYAAGMTSSDAFPVSLGAFDTTFNGGNDAFVTELRLGAPPGLSILWIVGFVIGAAGLALVLLLLVRRNRGPPAPKSGRPGLSDKVR